MVRTRDAAPVRRPRSSLDRRAHTSLAGPATPVGRLLRAGRFESSVGFVVGVAVLSCAVLSVAAALAGLADGGHRSWTMVGLGALWLVVGLVLVQQCRPPDRLRSSTAFVGVLASWLAFVTVSTITYLVLGTFEHWDDAIFESVAGSTTTAATVLADPESVGHAVLTWRAGTQWIGGLAALLFVVAVLPSIGVGGLEVTTAGQRHSGTPLRSHRTTGLMERLGFLYVVFTVAGVVLYLAGGMSPFDSVAYAATTISTGGFANHAGSFNHFDSVTVEWAGVGGMVLGGANMALLYRAIRGREPGRLLRSVELRGYLVLVLGAGVVVALTTAPDGGLTHESIRRSFFHVASATSTTGHFVGDGWGAWSIGPQVLLLAVIGVGAMSGSAGGGFRQVRALALLGYLRRELVVQIHPRAVAPVRVGRRVVGDELVNRMIGYQAQYLLVAGAGAVIVAALGADLVTAVSGAISALANMGPALGDLVPGAGGVLQLPRPARAALWPLMLLGRLEIAPVLVALSLVARRVDDHLPVWRWRWGR